MFVLAALLMLMLMRLTVLNIFMYSSPVSLLNHAHDVWYWVSSLTKYGLHLSCRLVYVSVSATVWYLFSFLQDIAIVQPLFCHFFFAFFRCCCKCVFHSTDKKLFISIYLHLYEVRFNFPSFSHLTRVHSFEFNRNLENVSLSVPLVIDNSYTLLPYLLPRYCLFWATVL